MSSLKPLIPLLIAAGILLGGNGLQGTLIAVRGAHEGFSPAMICLISSPDSVSYSSRPSAIAIHAFFFLVRIARALS